MYKTKDKEGKEKRRREEAGGSGEVLIGRGSGNSGASRQQWSKQATVEQTGNSADGTSQQGV